MPINDWNLLAGDPLSLTLVADARLCELDFLNDQIWEIKLGEGDPPSVAAWTTFGLRARGLRVFPRFKEGGTLISDPKLFWRPPAVHKLYPNYLLLTYSPIPGLDVVSEYWVPENHAISGRIRITNNGVTPRELALELTAILNPAEGGQRMSPARIQEVAVLAGKTGNLAPVLFLTGGSKAAPSPYPALAVKEELLPGLEADWIWVQASLENHDESFELARSIAARSWDSEVARIELENASQVEIKSGNPDWDSAFAQGQKLGLSLVHGPGPGLSHLSFVSSRTPDQGYSLRGDGLDFDPPWTGQTPIETWYLARTLLPSAPLLVTGFLLNFLESQGDEGLIDWKPGLAGQRSRLLATPLLAHIAWLIYEFTEDLAFLDKVYPDLFKYFLSWFSGQHDRDGDGIPEWDHVLQAGLEDHPFFSVWNSAGNRFNISMCETPSLNAFLFREAETLMEMSALLDHPDDLTQLKKIATRINKATEATWDTKRATYLYRDQVTHQSHNPAWKIEILGSAKKRLRKKLSPPARIMLSVLASREIVPEISISITGKDHQSKSIVETTRPQDFFWGGDLGTVTSKNAFSSLEAISVEGNPDEIRALIGTVDLTLEDLTLLLPLWAGIPGQRRATALIRRAVENPKRYANPFGLPLVPSTHQKNEAPGWLAVDIPWNALIAEGVLGYGMREEAAGLVSRLMDGIVKNLKYHQAFRARHDAISGEGIGDRNSLSGLPPLGLFLDTLGVRLINPWKVALEGKNPFPWPVEVQYRGLIILRDLNKTTVTFPDGEMVEIDDPADVIVER